LTKVVDFLRLLVLHPEDRAIVGTGTLNRPSRERLQ
jgi:hypothetical protein